MKQVLICLLCITLLFVYSVQSMEIERDVQFAVFSDPHLYDKELGIESPEFQVYLQQDRKMIVESEAILTTVIDSLTKLELDFVIIPGDLTKDGAKHNHEKVVQYLEKLVQNDIQIFVVPGNHDVNNSHAFAYDGDTTTPIDSVSPEEFATIYAPYGYNQAIHRDPNSLSYIVEPIEGLWLFCLDACRYTENTSERTVTGGKFSVETLSWIKEKLEQAQTKNKWAIGQMHHGVLEHYAGQKQFFSDYVVDDYKTVSALFAEYGMQLVFTGHYHSQDISKATFEEGQTLYDIETGSLVTYPCPFRMVTLHPDKIVDIKTHLVNKIGFDTNEKTFQQYALNYLETGLQQIVLYTMTAPTEAGGYGIPEEQANLLLPIAIQAFIAHYYGDENMPTDVQAMIQLLSGSSDPNQQLAVQLLGSLYTDLPPEDNHVIIDLQDTPSRVVKRGKTIPEEYKLKQNYPNPFNPETTISFHIPISGKVVLNVYDMLGRKIRTLVNAKYKAGEYRVVFNAESLPSGIYFAQLKTNGIIKSMKMTLIK